MVQNCLPPNGSWCRCPAVDNIWIHRAKCVDDSIDLAHYVWMMSHLSGRPAEKSLLWHVRPTLLQCVWMADARCKNMQKQSWPMQPVLEPMKCDCSSGIRNFRITRCCFKKYSYHMLVEAILQSYHLLPMFWPQISGCCKVWSLCHLRFPHGSQTKAMKPQELDPSFHPIAAISSSPHMNSSGNRGCGNESNVYSRIAARNGHRCRREVYIEQLHLRHIIARCCKILQVSSILYLLIRFDPILIRFDPIWSV